MSTTIFTESGYFLVDSKCKNTVILSRIYIYFILERFKGIMINSVVK